MNRQQTVYNLLLTGNPRSIATICGETGLPKKSIRSALRTLTAYELIVRSVGTDGKTKLYKAIERKKRPDIRGKILAYLEEHSSATPSEIAKAISVVDNYARHSLRCMFDQRIVRRAPISGTRNWVYSINHDEGTFGRSERLAAFYGCLVPVQSLRMAA